MEKTSRCLDCGSAIYPTNQRCLRCHKRRSAKDRQAKQVSRKCKNCGETFRTLPSSLQWCCCKKCSNQYNGKKRRNRVQLTCGNCSKRFDRPAGLTGEPKRGLSFCCKACFYAWNTGENHVLWEGGQDERNNPESRKWRRLVLKRDGKRCRRCFTQERLQVHHIKRFGSHPEVRWEVWNGITLCRNCHLKFQGKEEEYERILLGVASWNETYCETLEDFYEAIREGAPCS